MFEGNNPGVFGEVCDVSVELFDELTDGFHLLRGCRNHHGVGSWIGYRCQLWQTEDTFATLLVLLPITLLLLFLKKPSSSSPSSAATAAKATAGKYIACGTGKGLVQFSGDLRCIAVSQGEHARFWF